MTELNDNTARLLYDAIGHSGRWALASFLADGTSKYTPQYDIPLTISAIQEHLDGDKAIGVYLLNPDGVTTRALCWDADSTDIVLARRAVMQLLPLLEGLPHSVEFSGRKGYHVWIFFDEPVPATVAKALVDTIIQYTGLPKSGSTHIDGFPRQAKLSGKNWGNLLKVPLGKHPANGNRSFFVYPDRGWEYGPAEPAAEALTRRVTLEKVQSHVAGLSIDVRLAGLLTPYWTEGKRHDMAGWVAGYLAVNKWPLERTIALVEVICQRAGDEDDFNRVQYVRDTYAKVETGEKVAGYSRLVEELPQQIFRIIHSLVTDDGDKGSIIAYIDSIRVSDAPVFRKVRTVEEAVIGYLREYGELLRSTGGTDTESAQMYWLSNESKLLYNLNSDLWYAACHGLFGLNKKEGFSGQVLEGIRLKYLKTARIVVTSRLSYWDGSKLYVNMGGRLTYRLNGKTIDTIDNGDDGIVFESIAEVLPEIDLDNRAEVWETLVDDISFTDKGIAQTAHAQQREILKAWILSVLFPQLMPTKPILMLLGAAGSGKTTAARRIIKLLEGPSSEVLELVTDKQDAFRSSVMAHRIMVLDNLEKTTTPWIVDALNRLATGTHIEIRELFNTNRVFRLRPQVYVIATSVQMPFSEDTLLSRILPLECAQIEQPKPENMLQETMRESWPLLWADLLHKLNETVSLLQVSHKLAPHLQSSTRLADFSSFCHRVSTASFIEAEQLLDGIGNLTRRQQVILKSSSPFVAALEIWLRQQHNEMLSKPGSAQQTTYSLTDLFMHLQPLAKQHKMNWPWREPRNMASHIAVLEPQLRAQFGIISKNGESEVRYVFSWQGKQTAAPGGQG